MDRKPRPKPWLAWPKSLVQHALRQASQIGDYEQRIAFLLLDTAGETLLRSYLFRSEAAQSLDHGERVKDSKKFHTLVGAVWKADPVFPPDLQSDLLHFHELRNQLYHEQSPITVGRDQLNALAEAVLELLALVTHDEEYSGDLRKTWEGWCGYAKQVEESKQTLNDCILEIHRLARRGIERIAPNLLRPTVIDSLRSNTDAATLTGFVEWPPELRQIAGEQTIGEYLVNAKWRSEDPSWEIWAEQGEVTEKPDLDENALYLTVVVDATSRLEHRRSVLQVYWAARNYPRVEAALLGGCLDGYSWMHMPLTSFRDEAILGVAGSLEDECDYLIERMQDFVDQD